MAKAIAAELGIVEYRAGLLPEDKLDAVESLQKSTVNWQWRGTA